MKATQAKELTNDSRKVDMSVYYGKIEAAARRGESSVQINLVGISANHPDLIINTLKDDGYAVHHEEGYDQRDDMSWNFLSVSW
jgi:hypothetical protein